MHEATEPVTVSGKMIYFFAPGGAEGDPSRKDILGGKGASLCAMSQAGLPVPPGFTISIDCCRHYHDRGRQWPEGLADRVRESIKRLEAETGRTFGRGAKPLLVSVRSGAAMSMPGMMDTILNCGLSPALADEVADPAHFWRVYAQFIQQFGNTVADVPLAEFHKAVESVADDTPDRDRRAAEAMIGVYETRTGERFPTDPWDALTECINTVFDSWNNERARIYRRSHGLQHLDGTAVNVQAMFDSRVSGIAFTANPARPTAREIVIESAFGLGESIVSGNVVPDRWVLDGETLEITEREIGTKEAVMTGFTDSEPPPDPEAPSLTDEQILDVARIALKVESYYGHAVDIEWGLADGQFSLLQARAVRGLEVARDVEVGRRHEIDRLRRLAEQAGKGKGKVWVVHNLSETLEAPTPLTWDIVGEFMTGDGGFGRMYQDFGYRPSERVRRDGFLELICGRIYADTDRNAELFWEGMPLTYDHEQVLENPRLLDTAPTEFDADRADEKFLARLPGTLWAMLKSSRKMKRLRPEVRDRFENEVLPPYLDYVREKRDMPLADLPTDRLLAELDDRIARVLTDFGGESLKPGFFGGLARAELETKLIQLAGCIEGERLCQVLTSGLDGDLTVEQNAMLFDVARGAATMADFLEAYGHRGVGEMELSRARHREDTGFLEKIVAGQSTSEEHSPRHLHHRNEQRREEAMAELPQTLAHWGGSWMREDIEALAREAQELLPYRETGKHYLMMGYETIRRVLVELGRRWDLGRDVFFLRRDELPTFESDGERLGEAIAKRKTRWLAFQRLDLPGVIDSNDLDGLGLPQEIEASDQMDALSLSAGVADGTVRIIFDPGEAADLGDDCILVCPSTDPSWTALFTSIKGLVVERGGVLSHGAITARDFSIPAVACPKATQILEEGARVRIDGDQGRITIIEEQGDV